MYTKKTPEEIKTGSTFSQHCIFGLWYGAPVCLSGLTSLIIVYIRVCVENGTTWKPQKGNNIKTGFVL